MMRPRALAYRLDLHSIQLRLPLAMTGLLALAIAAGMVFAYESVRQAALLSTREQLDRAATQVADLLTISAHRLKAEMERDTRHAELRDLLTAPSPDAATRARTLVGTLRDRSQQIIDIELWDERATRVLAVSDAGAAIDSVVRQELITLMKGADSAVMGPLRIVADSPAFVVAAPVVGDGRRLGYLVQRGRLSDSDTAARALAALIGGEARVLLGNVQRDVWTDLWMLVDPPAVAPVTGTMFEYDRVGVMAGPKFAQERAVSGTPWVVVVERPRGRSLAPVAKFLRDASLFAGVLLVGGAIGLSFLSHHLIGPLSDLREAAVAIAEGKQPRRLELRGDNELGQLGRAFDSMASQVAEAHRNLRRQLATAQGQYRVLVDGIRDYAIFMMDRAGNVVSWNAGAERIKGYRADEILGRHYSTFYPEEDRRTGKPWTDLETARREGRFEGEGWRIRKDGSRIWASVLNTALHDEHGNLVGFAKVTRDISERRKVLDQQAAHTRALEQANAELDRHRAELKASNADLEAFSYSVSHDLSAPIRRIEGFSKILRERLGGDSDLQALRALHHIGEGARHMRQLVDDLLRLSQVDQQAARLRVVALYPLVADVVQMVGAEHADRAIDWRVGPMPTVTCDQGLLKIALTNLLTNAVKYTRTRSMAVIEIGHVAGSEKPVIYVRDNGVGFDMKYADRLFGVFQRLHGADEFEGTGIGLATVHRILRKHGGRVWADAAPDAGATFFFTLGTSATVPPTPSL